jgi:serine protease Do
MQTKHWLNRAPRAAAVPVVFALGAVAAMGIRGNAGPQQSTTPPVQPPTQALDIQNAFEQVADKIRPSVVYIKSRQAASGDSMFRQGSFETQDPNQDEDPFRQFFKMFPNTPGGQGGQQFRMMPSYPHRSYASGSGVIVRSDGYILTNDHVVNGADKVTVRLQDGREFVGQVKPDFKSDLALIKIDATNLPAAQLADSDKARVGQWAIAFGSPFGLSDTMTVGVVSALNREQQIGSGTDGRLYPSLIQSDASINPGNSGGPLVDIYGRVVGINVAIESPSGGNVGIGFAIPAKTANYIMNQLINKGSVTRGYLGLAPQTLSYDEQQRYGVKQGALVTMVSKGTPASKAGFQVEDVIVRYDGQPIPDDAALRDMVSRTAPGTTVPIVVRRNGEEVTIHATIGASPVPKVATTEAPARDNAQTKLGVSVGDAADANVRQQFHLGNDVTNGAVVAEVNPGSPAAEAGIQPGDVILRLNGKPIANAEELTSVTHNLKDTGTVTAVIRRGGDTILAQISFD